VKFSISKTGAERFVSQLTAEKKKLIIFLSLLGVMIFMWVKVLRIRANNETVENPVPKIVKAETAKINADLKLSFVDLPEVVARHDVLKRDYFASNGWSSFTGEARDGTIVDVEEVGGASEKTGEEIIRRVAAKLQLEVIAWDESPHAFINNRLLRVGDTLAVRDGAESYECQVLDIGKSAVSMRCGGRKLTLRLTPAEGAMH
jgi:hypothetical protein